MTDTEKPNILFKFQNEKDMHSAYTALKTIKLKMMVDRESLILAIFSSNFRMTDEEIEKLVRVGAGVKKFKTMRRPEESKDD